MYRGFNLSLDKYDYEAYYKIGLDLYTVHKNRVERKIEDFKNDDEKLNGSKMQANWFPQIRADVFISHSHNDREIAIALAGWLGHNFKIKTFIDSCVWDYADSLLRIIDNEYCKTGKHTYNYERRNLSTSHVHMMLSTALTRMIDNTECVFFLNTPRSITPFDVINQTESPWIYSEIEMTRLVRKKNPEAHRIKFRRFSEVGRLDEGGLVLQYNVDLSHLTKLDENDLNNWMEVFNNDEYALDVLYEHNPII